MTIILSKVNRFLKKSLEDSMINLQLNPFAYVATLPCETFMSAKQAPNEKLQGNVAAYLR